MNFRRRVKSDEMFRMQESVCHTYTAAEFVRIYGLRGYGSKKDALKWLAENGMETAHESDFERCYYDLQERRIEPHGRKYIAMRTDGTNQSAPQNQPNSKGLSFNAQMMRAQREIDATERWVKKMKEDSDA